MLPGKITHQLLVGGGDGITEIEGEGSEAETNFISLRFWRCDRNFRARFHMGTRARAAITGP